MKKGDQVGINLYSGDKRVRGIIDKAVYYDYKYAMTTYRVDLETGISVNIPEPALSLIKPYDGNELTSWADLRHIFKPEVVS